MPVEPRSVSNVRRFILLCRVSMASSLLRWVSADDCSSHVALAIRGKSLPKRTMLAGRPHDSWDAPAAEYFAERGASVRSAKASRRPRVS